MPLLSLMYGNMPPLAYHRSASAVALCDDPLAPCLAAPSGAGKADASLGGGGGGGAPGVAHGGVLLCMSGCGVAVLEAQPLSAKCGSGAGQGAVQGRLCAASCI